ncbi:MAG: hypothetical protein JWO88_2601, partial [Frankiales bacterium]|nr:hypothetical protein [Frankiales bacterium]
MAGGHSRRRDSAEAARVHDPHVAQPGNHLHRLKLGFETDVRTGELVLTEEVLRTMREEVERQRALAEQGY